MATHQYPHGTIIVPGRRGTFGQDKPAFEPTKHELPHDPRYIVLKLLTLNELKSTMNPAKRPNFMHPLSLQRIQDWREHAWKSEQDHAYDGEDDLSSFSGAPLQSSWDGHLHLQEDPVVNAIHSSELRHSVVTEIFYPAQEPSESSPYPSAVTSSPTLASLTQQSQLQVTIFNDHTHTTTLTHDPTLKSEWFSSDDEMDEGDAHQCKQESEDDESGADGSDDDNIPLWI